MILALTLSFTHALAFVLGWVVADCRAAANLGEDNRDLNGSDGADVMPSDSVQLPAQPTYIDGIEEAARASCFTGPAKRDYNGQVAGTMVTDSGGKSQDAEWLCDLADAGRFRVVAAHGRMVIGYWPENDPEKKPRT